MIGYNMEEHTLWWCSFFIYFYQVSVRTRFRTAIKKKLKFITILQHIYVAVSYQYKWKQSLTSSSSLAFMVGELPEVIFSTERHGLYDPGQ